MVELFQTEWCPSSHRVRQRLTELGIDYINRQVPVDRDGRRRLRDATGADTIPVLLLEDGSVVVGEENIHALLDDVFTEPPEANAQRRKAARVHRRSLEEECPCLTPDTR